MLDVVSLTGPDDVVNVVDLSKLADEFPKVEIAVLYMPEREGTKRFPSKKWIETFKANYTGKHTAMHLCGSAFFSFLNDEPEVLELMKGIGRIQLNLKFGDVPGSYEDKDLIAAICRHPETKFILQYTDDNAHLLDYLQDVKNVDLLFDGSAGQGILPSHWPVSRDDFYCGYAGGLGPDVIEAEFEKIITATQGKKYWIDMESGIRTNDELDFDKMRAVLRHCLN